MKVPTAVIMVHVVMMENVCAMLDISEATAQVNIFFEIKTYLDMGCVHLVNVGYKLAYDSHNCYI